MFSAKVHNQPLILIGPLKVGKTTVGQLLAEKLGSSFYSLDRLERRYTEPVGFDIVRAEKIRAEGGDWAWYTYRRSFFDEAVAGFLQEHNSGVLELGAGHPISPNEARQRRISRALAPFHYVILLLPTADIPTSLRILNGRQRPEWRDRDWNRYFLKDRRYQRLATYTIYTEGHLPEETCADITRLPGLLGL